MDWTTYTIVTVMALCFVSFALALIIFAILRAIGGLYIRVLKRRVFDDRSFPKYYSADQPWRTQTDIRVIEQLKAELLPLESQVVLAHRHNGCVLHWDCSWNRPFPGLLHRFLVKCGTSATFDPHDVSRYLELRTRIDRLWSGNARLEIKDLNVEIQKLKRDRQDLSKTEEADKLYARELDHKVIELERDLSDLEELVARAKRAAEKPPTHEDQFEEKKRRRTVDLKDEIFEAFEGPVQKEVELRLKYNELREKIAKNREIDPAQRDQLLEQLEKHFQSQTSKREHSSKLRIYKANG